jgi:hypothetical protein
MTSARPYGRIVDASDPEERTTVIDKTGIPDTSHQEQSQRHLPLGILHVSGQIIIYGFLRCVLKEPTLSIAWSRVSASMNQTTDSMISSLECNGYLVTEHEMRRCWSRDQAVMTLPEAFDFVDRLVWNPGEAAVSM